LIFDLILSLQPMSDIVGFFGNSLNELKGGQYMAPQTPQTPTSIPDIILTGAILLPQKTIAAR
jgi:hypothetical protein